MKIYNLKDRLEYVDEIVLLEHNEWASNKELNKNNRLKEKRQILLDDLNKKDFVKLILLDNNNLIGFISIFPYDCDEYPDLTPWYATMYVKKEYRGKGYSKILNDAIIEEAKRLGYKTLYLKTTLNNYYEKFGAKYIENITEDEKLLKFDL